jgi:hypothetical protein
VVRRFRDCFFGGRILWTAVFSACRTPRRCGGSSLPAKTSGSLLSRSGNSSLPAKTASSLLSRSGNSSLPAKTASSLLLGWRAANRIRPFDGDGNGYRDTLH